MNKLLPTCKEVSHLTSQAMDESLPWKKRLGLRLHLWMCVWCKRNADQWQLMQNLANRQATSQNEHTKLSSDARERINKSIENNNNKQ